jgi:hypothetical protein
MRDFFTFTTYPNSAVYKTYNKWRVGCRWVNSGYTRIQQDTAGYTAGYSRIQQDTAGYSRIQQDTAGYRAGYSGIHKGAE